MAARSSNKPFSEGTNTTMKGFDMNATMTTIDGSEKARYGVPMVSIPSKSTLHVHMSVQTAEETKKQKKMNDKYRNCRYKKYFVLEPEPYVYPQLERDRSAVRIKDEIHIYTQLKSSERLVEINGALTYFLISSEWVNKWRSFVQNGGPYPGKVYNEPIARKIYDQRMADVKDRYAAHDN